MVWVYTYIMPLAILLHVWLVIALVSAKHASAISGVAQAAGAANANENCDLI